MEKTRLLTESSDYRYHRSQSRKFVDLDKEKNDMETLQKQWDKESDDWYKEFELRSAVDRIMRAAQEFTDSLDGAPFGLTSNGSPPSSLGGPEDIQFLIEALEPSIVGMAKRADEFADEFGPDERDKLARFKWNQFMKFSRNPEFDAGEAGFQIGLIFGARLAGASPAQMDRLKKGLIRERLATYRYRYLK
ncbi:MAG TPA: hypothetical protein VGK77_18290 [Candidatus Binatia bacterium]|jgi:hypothetical protein